MDLHGDLVVEVFVLADQVLDHSVETLLDGEEGTHLAIVELALLVEFEVVFIGLCQAFDQSFELF